MKIPQLHPRDLLADMKDHLNCTPATVAVVKHHLVVAGGEVEIVLGSADECQIQLSTAARTAELSMALKRLLNVWDDAPQWIWQLDAMLDPHIRLIASQEARNRRPDDNTPQ